MKKNGDIGKGVFHGFLLLFCEVDSPSRVLMFEKYLEDSFQPTFTGMLKHGFNMVETFIGSWMLSSIVRYKPDLWLKILEAKEDDIINNIREFRMNHIPELVKRLFQRYGYQDYIPGKWGSTY